MFKIICVTNRNICRGDFLARIDAIGRLRPAGARRGADAAGGEMAAEIGRQRPDALILREKDLSQAEYERLAQCVLRICEKNQLPCILHGFPEAAKKLGYPAIHLPLPLLRGLSAKERSFFKELGASCHSLEEAGEAESLGCTYITAGHIFDTDCKKGLPGRGLAFLENVCRSVAIPVYAIGGIGQANINAVRRTGAAGACSMSGFMKEP